MLLKDFFLFRESETFSSYVFFFFSLSFSDSRTHEVFYNIPEAIRRVETPDAERTTSAFDRRLCLPIVHCENEKKILLYQRAIKSSSKHISDSSASAPRSASSTQFCTSAVRTYVYCSTHPLSFPFSLRYHRSSRNEDFHAHLYRPTFLRWWIPRRSIPSPRCCYCSDRRGAIVCNTSRHLRLCRVSVGDT